MRVLCPIDFSEASVNACKWIANFLDRIGGGELHICHFVHFDRRAGMFISLHDLLVETATQDLLVLIKSIKLDHPSLEISFKVYISNPKEGIKRVAKKWNCDLICTGTTGLNAIKDLTIGSVSQYTIEHSEMPVIVVPHRMKDFKIDKIALSVDDSQVKSMKSLYFLNDLILRTGASFELVHVGEENDDPIEYDPSIDLAFNNVNFEYVRLINYNSVPETLHLYSDNSDVDLLVIVHHKRNWLQRLLHRSTSHDALFRLEIPLLVLAEIS